jgi:hypothetical protein
MEWIKKSDIAAFTSVVNFFTSIWVFLFVVCFIVHLQLFIFPQFIFFPLAGFPLTCPTSSFRPRLPPRCQVV